MRLTTTPDPDKSIDLIAHPILPGLAAVVTVNKLGEGAWKGISKEDALELARKLEAYALGE